MCLVTRKLTMLSLACLAVAATSCGSKEAPRNATNSADSKAEPTDTPSRGESATNPPNAADSANTASETAPAQSPSTESESTMKISSEPFGKADGQDVALYTLTNRHGMKVKIMTYGAIVTSVEVPDRNGKLANVNLGFDNLEAYLKGHPFFGAIAGRYANRIAQGKFTLDSKEYTLAVNNGPNHLHGGLKGFDKAVWKVVAESETPREASLVMSHTSPDGDEGYPGELLVSLKYTLTDQNELRIDYQAGTDAPTVVNLTNHCYWNLAGAGSGDVLKQELSIHADKYLPVDATQIPTGELRDVTGTPMDFRTSTAIGARIADVEGGYDHCYVINGANGKDLKPAARVKDPASGRVMEISTTEPGIQFYTGNGLGDDDISAHAGKHGGFCLETQHYPDSPNRPEFPTTVLKPGDTFRSTTVHKFSVE